MSVTNLPSMPTCYMPLNEFATYLANADEEDDQVTQIKTPLTLIGGSQNADIPALNTAAM